MKSELRNSLFSEGKFALGFAVGLAVFTGFYLINSAFNLGFQTSKVLEVAPTLLTLFVAGISLIISYHALSEQRKMRQAGTDPVILVHLGNREDARIMSTLEVRNVGAGAALNVSLKLVSDITEHVPDRIMYDFRDLIYPIRAIPQDHSVSYNFGLGHKLLSDPAIDPIEFLVSYEDIDGNKHSTKQWIDVRELTKQRADDPLNSRLTKAVEKIAKNTAKV